MEDEHHYLQIITPEEDATCTGCLNWNRNYSPFRNILCR
jgi:hypothetical protein